jgi:hypothetical protein
LGELFRSFILLLFLLCVPALAHDNGQYAQSSPEIRNWFNGLRNEAGGQCCSFADGISIDDPDWQTSAGGYQVFYRGKWLVVPPKALVKGNNKIGHAVLWPLESVGTPGVFTVRCFMPGSET